jgi:hypothetical protein
MMISAVLMAALVSSSVLAYDTNFSLHGSRASFLMLDSKWMTLNYLHPNANKVGMRNAAKANGDTHIYLYTRNGGDNGGGYNLSAISPQPDWEVRLDELNNAGLKPVLWLTPDDSPSITNQSMDAQKAHFDQMVARFDSRVTGYVTCLECNEYFSAAEVQALVAHLKSKTNKPVGVHLTPGVQPAYFANADYVFLQTGFNKTAEQVKAMVAHAIAVTGKPVVASEYHLESRSANARALGDAACSAGAIGTGNGRSITFCGAEEAPKKKNNDTETAMVVVGIALVAVGAYYLHTNYDFELKMDLTDNYQLYGTQKTFNLFEKNDNSLNFKMELSHTTTEDSDENKIFFGFSGTF